MIDQGMELRLLKHYEDRFAEIERRVRMLMVKNQDLKNRVKELDQELAQARRKANLVEHLHGEKIHIKEKIEQLLKSLERAKGRE
ncbi:MAG TPA: hypothetical protein VLX29_00395 [Nitrospirota bacterium]|nr:hypothetical protein [Nitrospirota bacterium]